MVPFVTDIFFSTNDLFKGALSKTNLISTKEILKKQTLSVIKFGEIKPK